MLPDPKEALRLYLRTVAAPTPEVGTRIGANLPGSDPAVQLADSGGLQGYDWGEPLVLVSCWGRANAPDDGTASLVARTIAEAVEDMRGPFAGGYVAGASVDGGISDAPDPRTARPRQQFVVRLQTAPATEETS